MAEGKTKEKTRRRPIRGAFGRMFSIKRSTVRADDEFQKLRTGLTETRHVCPHDGAPMELHDVFPVDEFSEVPTDAEPEKSLVCPDCAFTVPISVMKERLKEEAAPFKQSERMFTLFAFGLFVGLGGISLLNGNLYTLLGGLLFSLMLFMNAIFYRYRYWQCVTGRLFEDRAPFGAFLSEDLLGRKPN